ncbi:MAG TPA: ATP-binding protein, partial [Flavisolibacter sp.]|nr:ATP-binding protein [Flavisolibacter sp.]
RPEIIVSADHNMLSAILRNLLSNALKFSPRGKNILIRTSVKNSKAVIEIIDEGMGIPANKLSTIFEPSEQKSTVGTEQEKGTGLGLLVVKEFVLLNRGLIDIESKVQTGTTVRLLFPLC